MEGNYKPQPVLKVEISKPQGGTRMLGIPTVTDRLIQQAIAKWLSPKYEEEFSNYSYGFRAGRNAHQAVLQAQVNLNDGYEWVIELDLENFFDRVKTTLLIIPVAGLVQTLVVGNQFSTKGENQFTFNVSRIAIANYIIKIEVPKTGAKKAISLSGKFYYTR